MYKKTLLFLLSIISLTIKAQTPKNFTTFSLDAPIKSSQIPKAEVGACMDKEQNIHIAWVKNINDKLSLMYSKFDNKQKAFNTIEINTEDNLNRLVAPFIITDNNNAPHIVYMIRRESSNTKSGNFAVMYTSDETKSGNFKTLQVSTNKNNPEDNSDNIYNCYVNGRPNIFFKNNTVIINYIADSNRLNNYNNYMIFATKTGNNWSYTQEFNTDDKNTIESYSISNGFSVSKNMDNNQYMAFSDLSGKAAHFINKSSGNWQATKISGYETLYDNENPQLDMDNSGKTHLFWYYSEDNVFCHTVLNGSNYSSVEKIKTNFNQGGNFYPATIDKTLEEPVYFYQKSFSDDGYIIFKSNDELKEIRLKDVGDVYGRKSLFADNGNIYLVTADDSSNKIFVTTNTFNTLSTFNKVIKNVKFYPNPTDDIVTITALHNITKIEVFDVNGKKINTTKYNSKEVKFTLKDFIDGTYILKAFSNEKVSQIKILKK
jgi:hypothetical protein